MLDTKILDIEYAKGLTKSEIENYFSKKKLKVIKWAVVGIENNFTKILTTFIKKF